MDDQNTQTIASTEPVKQVENKLPPNPEGKGGFGEHPEAINKNGRPPKGWAWSELLEEIGEEIEPKSQKQFKELVGRRLWAECINGNILAIKELFNRMEGLPRIKMEFDGKIDMRIPELIAKFDKILNLPDEQDQNTSSEGIS